MAKPHITCRVDWNADGDFGDANEDITADLIEAAFDHFRDLSSGYMNGLTGGLTLKNDDHKYSPPKGTITGLKAGRDVWFEAWYPYDDFVGSGGTALESHSLDEDSDWTWVKAGGAEMELDGGSAVHTFDEVGTYEYTLEFNDTDVVLGCSVTRGTDTTEKPRILLRFVDVNNYAYVEIDSVAGVILRKVIASVDTLVATGATVTAWANSTRKFVQVAIHGTNFRVLVDNIEEINTTLDDAAINGGTRHGVGASDHNDANINEFGGYRSIRTKLKKIKPSPAKAGPQTCYLELVDEFDQFGLTVVKYWNGEAHDGTFAASITNDLAAILFSADWDTGTVRRHFDGGAVLRNDDPAGLKALDAPLLEILQRWQDEEADHALFYFNGDAYLVIEERVHRGSAPHTAHRVILKDTAAAITDAVMKELQYDEGLDEVENEIVYRFTRSVESSDPVEIYKNEQAEDTAVAIQFDADETREIITEVVDHDAIAAFADPLVENTDYDGNSLANGTGSDQSSTMTVTVEGSNKFGGKFRRIKIIWGGTAGFLTKLRHRGSGMTLQDPTEAIVSDATSQTDYGARRKEIDCIFIDRFEAADDAAVFRLAQRKDPKAQIIVTLVGYNKGTMHHMVQRRVSDRIRIDYSDMGISNDDFYLEGESWIFIPGGDVTRILQMRAV